MVHDRWLLDYEAKQGSIGRGLRLRLHWALLDLRLVGLGIGGRSFRPSVLYWFCR